MTKEKLKAFPWQPVATWAILALVAVLVWDAKRIISLQEDLAAKVDDHAERIAKIEADLKIRDRIEKQWADIIRSQHQKTEPAE